jgi:hypothetical protein
MYNEFPIHQAVHGYSEGHRLLATSYQLSEKEQRILLGLSDRSGEIVPTFQEYLTGYPLPDSNFFAFAKTWHAPEMDRPGCVWTHTLLIERTCFRYLTNLHPLKSLFVRPHIGTSFSSYKDALSFTTETSEDCDFIFPPASATDGTDFKALYSILFRQLYENVKSVVLLAGDSQTYEEFILSLWSQQWPALRRRFTFCTGSMSGRSVQNHPFTLQVTPYQNYSLFSHKYPKLTFIDTRTETLAGSHVGSVEGYRTLRHKDDPLIRFVWHYGAQLKPVRKNFGWLARFYSLTHESHQKKLQLPKVTEYLASKFPTSNEMPELKATLYGGVQSLDTYVTPLADEEALLTELVKTQHAEIFDASRLNIYKRTVKLLADSPQVVRKIASTYNGNMEMNPIRGEFFQAVAQSLSTEKAFNLFRESTSVMLRLIDYNPKLAATPELWLETSAIREEVFNLLYRSTPIPSRVNAVEWRKIAYAMLDANTDDFTEQLYEILGEELVAIVLDWHSQSDSSKSLKQGWQRYLTKHTNKLIEWASVSMGALSTKALITRFLSPHSPEVRYHGSHPWIEVAENGASNIPREERTSVMAFILALGFMNLDEDSYKLVAASFQLVYDAAFKDSIPSSSWLHLEKLAPSEARVFEWDKCRRLEEALVSKTLKNSWPDELLFMAAKSPDAFWKILKKADDSSQGRKMLWRLYDKLKGGKIHMSDNQRHALVNFLDE